MRLWVDKWLDHLSQMTCVRRLVLSGKTITLMTVNVGDCICCRRFFKDKAWTCRSAMLIVALRLKSLRASCFGNYKVNYAETTRMTLKYT